MGDDLRNFCAGSIAGSTARFVSFPFDTVKVRMQHNPTHYKGYGDCFRSMLKSEGLKGFYRGLAAPVGSASVENAFLFWGYNASQRLWGRMWGATNSAVTDGTVPPPSMACVGFSGALAGVAAAFVNTPSEMLKVRMQVENMKPPEQRIYSGVIDVARKMVASGGAMSLLQGFTPTILREAPGNASWFMTYNAVLRQITPAGQTRADLPSYKIITAGGLAGMMYWTIFFPADVIKTKMQLDPTIRQMGFLRALQATFNTYGYRGLYSGWGITVLRAFPSNGVIFVVYENVVKAWDNARGTTAATSSTAAAAVSSKADASSNVTE